MDAHTIHFLNAHGHFLGANGFGNELNKGQILIQNLNEENLAKSKKDFPIQSLGTNLSFYLRNEKVFVINR